MIVFLTLEIMTKKSDLDALVSLDQKRAISAAEKARAGQKATNNEMAQIPKGSP